MSVSVHTCVLFFRQEGGNNVCEDGVGLLSVSSDLRSNAIGNETINFFYERCILLNGLIISGLCTAIARYL